MPYTYDLPDFKRYLTEQNDRNRIDGLVFWQNKIPLPIDLFNRMFHESDEIVNRYLDHLLAAIIMHQYGSGQLAASDLEFNDLPSKQLNQCSDDIVSFLQVIVKKEKRIVQLANTLSESIGCDEYKLEPKRLFIALAHQGKKYPRIYCPQKLRNDVAELFPTVFSVVASDKTDMIGNVIADYYNMYRAGFGDALSHIFNRLLDFRLVCQGAGGGVQTLTLKVEVSDMKVVESRTSDGSLWEPEYEDELVLRVNPEHPFFTSIASKAESPLSAITDLLYTLSKFEAQQYTDSQKKLIEFMRQEISRELWIKYEK